MTAPAAPGVPSARMAMLVDTSVCTGCRGCESACKDYNVLGTTVPPILPVPFERDRSLGSEAWTRIQYLENPPPSLGAPATWNFLKLQCMHCADANCVTACPSGAQKVTPQGHVFIDPDVCFGCSYCVLACPFDVPKFDAASGITQKCSFCVERTSEQGLEPMCVQTCPADAMDYGPWEEIAEKARRRAGALHEAGAPGASTYGEDLLGGLGAIYVLPGRPEAFGFTRGHVSLRRAAAGSWALALAGSLAFLVLPAVLYALGR